MIRLHVVQAEYGDCFILESKSGKHSVNILVDGGPYQTFEKHLKPALQKLLLSRKLDLMVLSHIDNDHIIGLLDLLEEIKSQREGGTKELVKVEKMWHNSFVDLLQFHEEPMKLLGNYPSLRNDVKSNELTSSLIMKGFQQGTDLTNLARLLKIPINPDFDKLIVINDKIKSVNLHDIALHLLGPTEKNVANLQKEWKKWSKEKTAESIDALVQILDKSIPNLASIAFLVEMNDRKILFTGDGLGQDILNVLAKNKMFTKHGKFYVDILKVPHHGSDRNTSSEFFNSIIAKHYIISANGRDDNPSLSTLRWIIESGKTSGEPKKIILTNITHNFKKILQEYDQNKYNYESIVLENKSHFMTIDLK
ncbi:MAG TPA: MBL fold metallo-hydrolase [Nitrososphaeraceae archaeon]|nr:MBL fold metallo-hydrolase [Nitrososphaeraceae archaeon]